MKRTSLLLLTALICSTVLQNAIADDGFKSLFNGKDLTGWKGNADLWSVEDDAITGTTNSENPLKFNTFLVWDEGEVDNFVLELDYRQRL